MNEAQRAAIEKRDTLREARREALKARRDERIAAAQEEDE